MFQAGCVARSLDLGLPRHDQHPWGNFMFMQWPVVFGASSSWEMVHFVDLEQETVGWTATSRFRWCIYVHPVPKIHVGCTMGFSIVMPSETGESCHCGVLRNILRLYALVLLLKGVSWDAMLEATGHPSVRLEWLPLSLPLALYIEQLAFSCSICLCLFSYLMKDLQQTQQTLKVVLIRDIMACADSQSHIWTTVLLRYCICNFKLLAAPCPPRTQNHVQNAWTGPAEGPRARFGLIVALVSIVLAAAGLSMFGTSSGFLHILSFTPTKL